MFSDSPTNPHYKHQTTPITPLHKLKPAVGLLVVEEVRISTGPEKKKKHQSRMQVILMNISLYN